MLNINKELLNGSLILLIAFNLFNFLNFVFQFLMARLLSPAEYGTLAALMSITYMTAIFSDSIQTIVTKYSSKEKNLSKIKNLFIKTGKKAIFVSIILFIIFVFLAIFLAGIWETSYLLVLSMGVIIFACLLTPISRGVMQGKKRFKSLGYSLIIESGLKIIIALIFVFAGYNVFGATMGIVLSGIIALGISLIQIKDILKMEEIPLKVPSIYQQSILIFIFTLAVTLFYSLDIIIAKAVFSPEVAGYYAIASILGKIVFWGTQPISKAMLPIISEKDSENKHKKLKHVFYSSLSILTLGLIIALVLFYEFPSFIVKVFSGKEIIESSSILFRVGLAMGILSYSNLILFYKIAISKENIKGSANANIELIKKALFFVIFIIIEVVILYFSLNSLETFSNGLILSAIIFLFGSFAILLRKK